MPPAFVLSQDQTLQFNTCFLSLTYYPKIVGKLSPNRWLKRPGLRNPLYACFRCCSIVSEPPESASEPGQARILLIATQASSFAYTKFIPQSFQIFTAQTPISGRSVRSTSPTPRNTKLPRAHRNESFSLRFLTVSARNQAANVPTHARHEHVEPCGLNTLLGARSVDKARQGRGRLH